MSVNPFLIRRTIVFAAAAIYWSGVAIHARRIRKRIGKSANLKPRTLKESILWLGWTSVIVTWLFQPALVSRSLLAPGMMISSTLFVGSCFVILGYVATLWCYASMGDAWRIGVNRNEKNTLVTRGSYGVIRHPIYAFQILMLLGSALLLPTVISLAILVVHFICVQIKAGDEESYLLGIHGETYQTYLRRTGRLFPKLVKR